MKKIIKIVAVVLVVALLATFIATRHKKGEIAYEIGGREFTSSMYSCVLYTAASNARNAIYSYVSELGEDTTNIKYEKYKFDENGNVSPVGTISYVDFVEKEALKVLRQYAAVLNSMEEKGIELDEETKEVASIQAYCYWNYGCDYNTYINGTQSQYSTPYYYYFNPNGVEFETYEQYMIYEYSYNYYFYELYGEDGDKEIPLEELKAYLDEHYALADSFSYSLTDADKNALSEDDKKVITDEANAFIDRLNKGESFDVIYEEFIEAEKKREEEAKKEAEEEEKKDDETSDDKTEDNKTEDDKTEDNKTEDNKSEDNKTEENKSEENKSEENKSEDEEDDEYEPEDYTSLFGDEDSEYASTHFEKINGLKVGEATLIEDTENKVLIVVQARDIFEEDNFWLDYEGKAGIMRDNIIYNLKNEEYDTDITALGNSYDAKEHKFATSPFKVKKLKFDLEA